MKLTLVILQDQNKTGYFREIALFIKKDKINADNVSLTAGLLT